MNQTGTRFCFRCGYVSASGEEVCPSDGSRLSAASTDPYIGKTLAGKYEVLSLLGRGGMSVVYKVRHLYMNRLEALKMLRVELTSDSDALQRFQREATAVAGLRHVNVVTVLEFGVLDDDTPFLSMEFLEGKDLGDVLKDEHHLTVERALPLFSQICAGLYHAHSRGVVHRDIKPSNILISTANGVDLPIIVDFGIAKLLHADGSTVNKLTTTGQVFGSPLYMSPEQCNSKKIDERTDVYALGCVFYQVLTGKPPIQGNNPLETMMRQIQETPRPFHFAKPDHKIPAEIERVIFKALAKHPEDRHANMNEFRTALLQAANLTVTDLNSGSYIHGDIIPGIDTAGSIREKGRPKHAETVITSADSLARTALNSSTEETNPEVTESFYRKRLFRSPDAQDEFSTLVGGSYRGILRAPVMQIAAGLVVVVMIAGGAIFLIPGATHNVNVTDRDGQENGRRPRYADETVAQGDSSETTSNLLAALPGSAPAGEARMMGQIQRAKSAVDSRFAGKSNLSSDSKAMVTFSRTQIDTWNYEPGFVDALVATLPGDAPDSGTIYHISFDPSTNRSGLEDLSREIVAQLKKSVALVSVKGQMHTALPVYQMELKYQIKDPQNPRELRSSYVLIFRADDCFQALQIVPGRHEGNRDTLKVIETKIIKMFKAL